MDKQDFIGMCPTCEKVCKQVGREKGWWQCGNCTWVWEPTQKQALTDRVKGEEVEQDQKLMQEYVKQVKGTQFEVPESPFKEEKVEHPKHYGGADNTYEVIKVIEAWGLGFHLGNAVKYISRAGKKGDRQEDLKKAMWYLERELGRAKD